MNQSEDPYTFFYKNTAYKNLRLEKLRTIQEQQGLKQVNLKNIGQLEFSIESFLKPDTVQFQWDNGLNQSYSI